jgi:phosphoribosylglycinamide formyltransferase-1
MAEPARPARRRTAVLISGRGSNLQALLAHCARPEASAQIALVISNQPAAGGLAHARAAGIATAVVDHRPHPSRESFEAEIEPFRFSKSRRMMCVVSMGQPRAGSTTIRFFI